ncbi:MAG: hypothetical protein KAU10_05010 [Dehalococcoidia bacterium]|nr:hypothetical protein [Dehalococcoidia bacterium]
MKKENEEKQLMKVEQVGLEKMSLEQKRQAERLYHQLGLDPVVDKVLKDFSGSLSGVDRATDRLFGPYDIKGRADAVARVTALATYAALHEQYSKELGGLETQIEAVEGERDKVRTNYDNLVDRVADVVGGDHDELKANYNQLVERLAEVEHLRSQVAALNKEKAQLTKSYDTQIANLGKEKTKLTEGYESQIATLRDEHATELGTLSSQLSERDARIEGMGAEKAALTGELRQLKTAVAALAEAIPYGEIGKRLGEESYSFLLKDSKVPGAVIDGVGKFIDFRKYLGMAAERGAREAHRHTEEILEKKVKKAG